MATTREPAGRMRASDLDPGRAARVVVVYLVAATLWIVGSGVVVDPVAGWVGVDPTTLEIAKGLLFVAFTGGVLHLVLRGWARRLQAAARAEHDAADRMRRAEEMRSTFLSGVSHELRTPLTAIVGYALTVHERRATLNDVQMDELSTRLVTSAGRLRYLIDDLLEVDRLMNGIGQVRAESSDLVALARRVVETVEADHHVEVVGTDVHADVDVAKVERALQHLIANAIRHAGSAGSIVVSVHGDSQVARLVVEDDGDGLPPALLGRIFDPFVQDPAAAASPSPGIGIGLTLVARFAALHDGEVQAENRAGGGARFTLVLPRRRTPHAAPAAAPRSTG